MKIVSCVCGAPRRFEKSVRFSTFAVSCSPLVTTRNETKKDSTSIHAVEWNRAPDSIKVLYLY